MIYIPIAVAALVLLRCFALEKRVRRQERRIEKLSGWLNRQASGS